MIRTWDCYSVEGPGFETASDHEGSGWAGEAGDEVELS